MVPRAWVTRAVSVQPGGAAPRDRSCVRCCNLTAASFGGIGRHTPSPSPILGCIPQNTEIQIMSSMRACPMTLDECNALIRAWHRHHGPVVGYRYGVGVIFDERLVGCAVIGRPVARQTEQYRAAEVTRVATDGTPDACSFLYGVCSRLCKELGFDRLFTFILETEPGTSLKAAGWVHVGTTKAEGWSRPSRVRKQKAPTCRKQVWAPQWCASKWTVAASARMPQ